MLKKVEKSLIHPDNSLQAATALVEENIMAFQHCTS